MDNKFPKFFRFTARLPLPVYDALSQIKYRHIKQTNKFLPLWKILEEAISRYAKEQGIKIIK